ncbi:D-alanyl-D-alanine carboxypeptidase [Rhizobium sp. SL86]|uniref:D-alanyl-D-alanine carboxypeptidase n=1 Tax=Rhizobium sp. SL86 TaxID=2995148 RepID=UPI002272DD75|nr:D-alanyl-D-alanine carboxypeptidase [Rhizobium sp. SL86]MCY1664301.1 D-alanyl-D-alanine carboxypeptidase [Rhizobium sp. SL86]
MMGVWLFALEAKAGYADFILDVNSGKVLQATNADELNHPASLTKMMTLYMVFEALRDGRLKWDQQIVMSANGARTIPMKLGIRQSQTYTVREAVYGMIVRSANDVAEGIGDHLYGSEERFGAAMTAKARQLGMSRTVFRNGSGLPDSRQVTTARDMARLGLALMRDFPREYQLFSTASFNFRGKTLRGHNNLMYRYKGMDGIKTGFTNASGFNLVSAVNDNGRRVIGVVLGGKSARSRDARMAELLDEAMPKAATRSGTLMAALRPAPQPIFPQAAPQRADVPEPVMRSEVDAPMEQQPTRAPKRQEASFPVAPRPPASAAPAIATPALPQPVIADRYTPSVAMPQQPAAVARTQAADMATPARSSDLAYAAAPKSDAPLPFKIVSAAGWRVEVGSAGNETEAISLLSRAMPKLDGRFQGLTPYTDSVHGKSGATYRARFSGFSDQAAALSACKVLKASSFACQVLPAGG